MTTRHTARLGTAVPTILEGEAGALPPCARGAVILDAFVTSTGVGIAIAGSRGARPCVAIKLALTPGAAAGLEREGAALAGLHGEERLAGWRALVPQRLAGGTMGRRRYAVDTAVAGMSGDRAVLAAVEEAAAEAIGELHRRTAAEVRIGDELAEQWVRAPAALLARHSGRRAARAILGLAEALERALHGRTVAAGWVHGDFWPGNLLVRPDGALSGIVDWDAAGPCELPLHDLLHLLLHGRRVARKVELGEVVVAQLRAPEWAPHERRVLRAYGDRPAGALPDREALLLYWLRHAAAAHATAGRGALVALPGLAPPQRRRGAGGAVRLVATGAAARPAWEAALAADELAVASQTPAWMDALCACTGMVDVSRAYVADDGRRLVLPLARRRLVRAEASPPAGWGAGGLVGPQVAAGDVAAVLADVLGGPAPRTSVRPDPSRDAAWGAAAPAGAVRTPLMAQSLPLGSFDEVWSHRFTGRVRGHCRRAERAGLEVESDAGGRLIPVFDRLYRLSVERWAEQQHEPLRLARWRARRRDPPQKFALVARHLGAACRVWVAWREGEAAAAIVVLRHGGHATYWRGAMDKALVGKTGANQLLHRLAIEDACATGAREYHLGDSSPGSGLAEFKRGFGAVERHYGAYRFERLPLTAVEHGARTAVKRVLRFRDA